MNTPVKGDNQLKVGLPSWMSEERQYGRESHRQQGYSEEAEDEPWINPVDGLYTQEEIEKLGNDDMRRKKLHISDCVLDTIPEHLKIKQEHVRHLEM